MKTAINGCRYIDYLKKNWVYKFKAKKNRGICFSSTYMFLLAIIEYGIQLYRAD